MKKTIIFLSIGVFLSMPAFAEGSCFLVKENNQVLQQEGDCKTRHTPGCDFNIPLSLMGFDSGILQDENNPVWPYKEGYEAFLNFWKQPHTPRTWIVESCVWYSGNIVDKVGYKRIDDYIHKFKYGNQDISGMNHTDWPGALLISAEEQVEFLQRLIDHKLFVSDKAYEMTEKILFIQDMPGRWKLYGKTGVGEGPGSKSIGWFIGWIAKDNRRIPFASCVVDMQKGTIPSFKAKNDAFTNLFWLINDLEK